jgi:hypothetical protein
VELIIESGSGGANCGSNWFLILALSGEHDHVNGRNIVNICYELQASTLRPPDHVQMAR